MERKHGYSISLVHLFDEEMQKEEQEKLFDLCETFIEDSGGNKIENNDWQILGEQCSHISAMNKHNLKIWQILIDIDKEMVSAQIDWMEEDRKYNENVNRVNDRILRAVTTLRGKDYSEALLSFLEESEASGPLEIVRRAVGTYQEDEEYGILKSIWVNQYRNGGYTGDDFAGDIYVEIKKNRFIKFGYSC